MAIEEQAELLRSEGTVFALESLDIHDAQALVELLYDSDVYLAFDLADGLYWYCNDNHGGMGSLEYRILCSLDYHPGPAEDSPRPDDEEREGAHYVYQLLSE